jgi:hypothetical protein
MATGLGKTVTFANIPRKGKQLIISHREELVNQPLKYYNCLTGIEMGKYQSTPMDRVVSASVQTLVHRLEKFRPDEFDTIIVDEAHHAAAETYRKVLNYFNPRLLLGFTATPNRSDNVRLDNIFDKIIFQRDLLWGIKNGYLSDIFCRRLNIGYDLSAVHKRLGDYAPGELDEAMSGTEYAIAEAYRDYAKGATLIFATSVSHAEAIASLIPDSITVTAKTKNRADIIKAFANREIPCLINCMVFTEGTDMPLVETVIIARPTQSESLYTQMVGRGLRLHPEKEKLNLIDCVGITGKSSLCTAPSLLGIDLNKIPEKKREQLEGDLFDIPKLSEHLSDCPDSWIKNVEIVNLWAKEQSYNTHNVNYFQMPNGDMICHLLDRKKVVIPAANELGQTVISGELVSMQEAFDRAYKMLESKFPNDRYIWDLSLVKKWGNSNASEAQKNAINKRLKSNEIDVDSLTKFEASQILNRLIGGKTA